MEWKQPGAGCTSLVEESYGKENTEGLLHPSMPDPLSDRTGKIGKKRGSVALIADTCGVSHGSKPLF